MNTAYDYDAQKWVFGLAALELQLQQLIEEEQLLKSNKGKEYCLMIGTTLNLALDACQRNIASLKLELTND